MAETATSTQRGFLDFSPIKRDDANKENDVPVLSLIQFSKAPFVTFGTVKLGTSRSAVLRLENPTEDAEAEVAIEKIPSSKGFSVDHKTFTIQPEGSFSLTVTWTPAEEGGIRELIIFNANGVLKHQAVLLGRAEAPKKKKKSLWDTIKNKRDCEKVAVPRGKKMELPLKMAANKTFQVSRKPQYKRDKPRSPLASLNEGKAVRERSLTKHSPIDVHSRESEEQKALNPKQSKLSLALSDQENIHHIQRNSPVVLLVPTAKLMDSGTGSMSASPDTSGSKPENKDLAKILNRTLSPIGTPERFKKLMPRIQSESPVPATVKSVSDADDANSELTRTPVLSLKDALALIDSDLSNINTSPRDSSSSSEFSDSLESKSGSHSRGSDRNVLKALPDSPGLSEPNEPRLTFFVTKKVVVNEVIVVSEAEADKAEVVKKASFTSATVTKSKAPVEENNLSGRKIKKSRRRLLEKTLELSDSSSQYESRPSTPKLPVIDPHRTDTGTNGWQNSEETGHLCDDTHQVLGFTSSSPTPPSYGSVIPSFTFPVTSPPSVAPTRFSFSVTSPPPAVPALVAFTVTSPSPTGSCSPLHCNFSPNPKVHEQSPTVPAPASVQEDSFPIHMAVKSKKRKSEEYLKSDAKVEDAGKTDRVKRSKVVAVKSEPTRLKGSAPPLILVTSPSPTGSCSPLHCNFSPNPKVHEQSPTVPAPASVQEDSFPIHMAVKSKKRKSEEYLKSDAKVEDAGKTDRVKRSKVVAVKSEPTRSLQERRSVSQRQQRTAGSVRSVTTSSLKSTRSAVPAQAKQPSSKLTSRAALSVKSSGASSVRVAKVVAVAQSKLTFIKPVQTAIPRHPMPFAAKNMFYDERWIEKQERGFTWWINYVLTPDDFKVNTEVAKVSAASLAMGNDDNFSVPKAPTKDEMSFSTYTARRKLNRLRRSACQLFTSEAMVKAIQRLELEVEAKRLLVRKDRHLWKDIGERKKVLSWLLSYNPLWLRIGLETIFGELISLESNSDAMGLAMFILQRLLWNPDIAAAFRHPKVPHLYKDGHEEALSRFTLKKLLLLVCFLDKAKESRLIEHDPCLFCVDAEFKTSKDLLLAFSRDFLSGEGILPRHLSYLGLPVSHIQKPLDEFNFAVKNLAVDLKCGIRLVRVMELLIQDWSLSAKLRLPAISRLQKVHNVDIALQVLKSKGVDLKDEHGSTIDSRDIVDGHREKTLSLLWKIIFVFHVEVILDEDQLREEIGFLKRTLRTKRRLVSLRADRGLQPSPAKTKAPYEHSSTKITLLMDWVRAVCDFYNLKVENFTVTFSDGRILCYLIHHYHPSLLPEKAISHSTTQTVECSPRGRLELSCSASDSDSSFDSLPTGPDSPSVEFKELLENEKNNFRLVNTAVAFLGGVPAMINPADMSNTIPNEKVVMSYLTFLCARLLDLRNETRAARVIQGAWRKYRLKKDLQLYKERNMAAAKIQLVVRSFLQKCRAKRHNQAATVIQSVWRGYAARNRLRLKKEAQLWALQHEAATVIQAQWRMFSTMRAYQRLRYYAIVVQAQWRMRRATSAYGRIYWAATVLQKHSRAWALARRDRERYLSLRTAVVKLQRGYRRWKAQKTEKENCAARVIQAVFKKWYQEKMSKKTAAAVRIQSWYKMQRCLHQYRKIKRSTVLIQALYRGHAQRCCFKILKLHHHSAIVIQSAFRGHAVRKQVEKMRCATVIIQRQFRATVKRDTERQKFVRMRCAAVTIQAAYRGKVARELLKKQHKAATVIQAAFRKHIAQRHYLVLRKAAAVIQQKYRATILARETKKDFEALRNAALFIQANWRGRADRNRIEKWHQCATLIQAYYRRHKAQAEYKSKKAAAVAIQRHYRAYVAGKEMRKGYLSKRAACVTLQAGFRGMRVRAELKKKHQAATVIQASVRMFLCRKQYILLQSASIIIQSRYRALLLCRTQQNEYRALKQATIKIQAVYRGFRVREDLKKRYNAARAIQAHFRMHRMRMAYLATKCAAIIIQERYRAKMFRDQQSQRYKAMKSAAVVIQAAYRGHTVRREVAEMHRAATVIQRKFLTIRDQNRFLAMKVAALVCQQRYRAVTLARKDRQDYLSKRRAVICLQAAYRGYESRWRCAVQRRIFQRKRQAAVTLQRRIRAVRLGRVEKNNYIRMRQAAITLQTRCRAWTVRRQALEAAKAERRLRFTSAIFHHLSAIKIQRALRAHRALQSAKRQIHSVITIQRWVRARQQRRRYLEDRRKVVIAQRAVKSWYARRHKAASVIQQAVQKFLLLRRQKRVQQGIVKAQALWRGHRSRRLNDNPKVVKLRHRLRQVSADVREEDKLCNKTSSALDHLLRYKHISFILEALKNLETTTRLSPECCERLVESGATNVIFTLIRCCNRSVPCMEIITFSIQILLNLSKYHKTVEAVYSVENSLETVLDLLQRYREKAGDKVAEKGGSIFTKACFLLALLLQDKHRAVEVMKLPKALDRIRSIYRLTARKHKMDAERTVMKQKMNASINGSFYVQATPRKSRPAPKFAPDWVLRKDKLKDIVDPLRAIQMVADTLSIVL
ncbi:abnormal spindle-like microcephaly-associated protein [Lates japonicus]|uniref:Abnormal spindle-like microcephaly-associated protein n=1 Tax=Lates japonicus TaxID=270547 RepID=A0AAD3M997_LATJO|nr:abnormal spindle-like microcephaly-associated protein [Lates japonicus]